MGMARPAEGDFYPRPPRGGRLGVLNVDVNRQLISIHALREEGDQVKCKSIFGIRVFLSTPSARRATIVDHVDFLPYFYFYPRPPRGGRPLCGGVVQNLDNSFLSTPSARRATAVKAAADLLFGISIHALREEGDPP